MFEQKNKKDVIAPDSRRIYQLRRVRIAERTCVVLASVIFLISVFLLVSSFFISYAGILNRLIQLYGTDRASRYFTPLVFASFQRRLRMCVVFLFALALAVVGFRARLGRVLNSFGRAISLSFQHESRLRVKRDAANSVALAVITLIGFAARLRFLNQPMRYDESATVLGYASKPLYLGLSIYNEPNNHLFHTLLVHIAMRLAGSAEWAIRTPALIAGTLMCPLAYALARRFANTTTALFTAAFVGTSSTLIEYSTNARGYTLICCATLALLISGFETLRRASPWWFFLFGFSAVIGFWTIPIFLLPFGGAFLWMAWESASRRSRFRRMYWIRLITSCVLAGAVTVLLYVPPIAVNGLKALTSNQWEAPRDLKVFVGGNVSQFHLTWTSWNRDLPFWWPWMMGVAFFAGIALFPRIRRLVFWLSAWVLFLFVTRRFVPFPRNWLLFLPIFLMTAASTLAWLLAQTIAVAERPVMVAAGAVTLTLLLVIPVLQKQSVLASTETGVLKSARQIDEFMAFRAIPPDRVFRSSTSDLPLEYYWWRRTGSRPPSASRQDLAQHGINDGWFLLNGAYLESTDEFTSRYGFEKVDILERDCFDGACLYHVNWEPSDQGSTVSRQKTKDLDGARPIIDGKPSHAGAVALIEELMTLASGIALAALVITVMPRFGGSWLDAVENIGARFAARKRLAIFSIFVLTILLRLGILAVIPLNPPQVHDEFSYLLASDTFVHGRLANPPHPMWAFLNTFHELQQPTYASMYPPAQGAALALGQLVGNPWIGVLVTTGILCAVMLWMLQGWFPARWALLGALFVVVRFGLLNYWSNSYWGGNVAAIGGALVLGSLPRIIRKQGPLDAVLLAVGAAILANSRPFEGFVLCVPVAIVLCSWMLRKRVRLWRTTVLRVVLPVSAVLILTAAFMGYYNWRVTGHPLQLPHTLDDQTNRSTGNFVWQKEAPPRAGLNVQFDAYYNHMERNLFAVTHHLPVFYWRKLTHIGSYFLGRDLLVLPLGSILLLPFVALPWALQDRRIRLLVVEFAVFFAGLLVAVWFEPHYAAPVVAAFVAILLQAFRHMRRWEWRGRPVGVGLTRAVALCTAALLPICVIQTLRHPSDDLSPLAPAREWAWDRAKMSQQLDALPGKQLVIVRYGPNHDANHEWVWNRADIDGSSVVWAREIPGTDISPLLEYFRARKVWLLEPDGPSPQLSGYPTR